ncbi:MAG: RNA polymerase sigma-54 factor [Phycisphaerales bacterium]|nr:MAG: RNA polymerase sigma-54 factor [Phycisphaerales bacterium]
MSQSLSQTLGQYMRLEQRLTPQLIQSMSILQMPVADLETMIAEELEKNSALEVEERAAPQPPADGNGQATLEKPNEDAVSFDRLDDLSRAYDLNNDDLARFRRGVGAGPGERDAKMEAMANTPGPSESLQEHLLTQWKTTEFADDEVRRAGEVIINHVDDDGYLRVPLAELCGKCRPPVSMETMETALFEVQCLEPNGVGARDVKECLLLQLDALPGDNRIERTLIQEHLEDVARNRIPAIARATGYSIGEIMEAIKVIRAWLHPHPGYLLVSRDVPPIRPDVIVEYAETGGGLTVRLARGNTPRLRVSPNFMDLARDRSADKDVRDFARKRVEAAGALIDAVAFRRSRLLDVARAIVEHQREFFETGPEAMQVLRMSDLAVELNCDPSTISRTVADKYVQTPRGIFPLRGFFTGGTETEAGETTSWDTVKARVAEIIRTEDPKAPLNDDRIAAQLKEGGIEISRRTVAKYRQQLDIPNARQRMEY